MTRRSFCLPLLGLAEGPAEPPKVLLLTSGRGHDFRVHGVFSCRETMERERKTIQATWPGVKDRPETWLSWNPPVEATVDRPLEVTP